MTITVDAESITDVVIEGAQETDGIGSRAVEELPEAIKSAQSEEVDAVAGATITSTAVTNAVNQAVDTYHNIFGGGDYDGN